MSWASCEVLAVSVTLLVMHSVGLNFSGVNFGQWKESDLTLDFASMKQETIVNRGEICVGVRAAAVLDYVVHLALVLSIQHCWCAGLKDMVVAAFANKHNSIKVAAAGNKVTSRL